MATKRKAIKRRAASKRKAPKRKKARKRKPNPRKWYRFESYGPRGGLLSIRVGRGDIAAAKKKAAALSKKAHKVVMQGPFSTKDGAVS